MSDVESQKMPENPPTEEEKTAKIPEQNAKLPQSKPQGYRAPLDVYYAAYVQQLQAKYPNWRTDPTQFAAYNKELRESRIYEEVQRRGGVSSEAANLRASIAFYTSLGYPEYAGKYEPFDIPQGEKVLSIAETEQGLRVRSISEQVYQQLTMIGAGKTPSEVNTWLMRAASVSVGRTQGEFAEYLQQRVFHAKAASVSVGRTREELAAYLQERQRQIEFWQKAASVSVGRSPGELAGYLQQQRQQREESIAFYTKLGYPELGGKYKPLDLPTNAENIVLTETPQGLQATYSLPHVDIEAQRQFGMAMQASGEFYKSLGYPELGGKYLPFKIPEGAYVKTVMETKEGLEVVFGSYEGDKKIAESRDFFTQIGYPEYAGKYEPFAIPEGAKISKIAETPEGLSVEFITEGLSAEATQLDAGTLAEVPEPLPPRSHFGPPSGYSYTPINLDELVKAGKVTVSPAAGAASGVYIEPPPEAVYKGLTYSEIVEKYEGKTWSFVAKPVEAAVKEAAYWVDPLGKGSAAQRLQELVTTGVTLDLAKFPGYEVVSVDAKPSGFLEGTTFVPGVGYIGKTPMSANQIVFTLEKTEPGPIAEHVGLFGPSVQYFDPTTGKLTDKTTGQVTVTRKTDPLYVAASKEPSIAEIKALLGFQLASTVALPVAIPKLIPFALGAVGVAEAAKYTITKQHITVPEAIGAAGIGEMVGVVTISALQSPRVQQKVQSWLSKSYMEHYQTQETMMFEYGEGPTLWEPSRLDRFLMRLTGAKPQAPATGYVSASTIPEKTPLSLKGLEAEWVSFEMGAAPKTGLLITTKPPAIPTSTITKLPVYFGLGSPYKAGGAILKEFRYSEPVKVEKGIPESTLAYDYRGPLSFENYPLKLLYLEGKTVGYAWTPPYHQAPSSTAGMKPLLGSIGTKEIIGSVVGTAPATAALATRTATPKTTSFVSGIPAPSITQRVVTRQTMKHPFLTYQGPSYYPQRSRESEEYETMFLSYPESGLAKPVTLTKRVERILQGPLQLPSQASIPLEPLILKPVAIETQKAIQEQQQKTLQKSLLEQPKTQLIPFQTPHKIPSSIPITIPIPVPKETPIEKTIQVPIRIPILKETPIEKETRIPKVPEYPPEEPETKPPKIPLISTDFDRKLGRDAFKDLIGGYGRYKRQYPIMTGKQLLKEVLQKKRKGGFF